MIRQAVNYLRGAISSVMLIGAAVVVAALIMVSVGTGTSPISMLGLGDSRAEPLVVSGAAEEPVDRRSEARRIPSRVVAASRAASPLAGSANGRRKRRGKPSQHSSGASRPASAPSTETTQVVHDPGSTRRAPTPPTSQPAPRRDSPAKAAGAGGGGGGGGGEIITEGPGRGGNTGGSGDGANDAAPPKGKSTTAGLNEGIGQTVDGLDKTLGGTLDKTGLKDTVKQATETLIGPESGLGKTVDGVTGGLGKLLGGRK